VTKDVKRYSERVGRFAAHLAKVEARNRDGMVDDNLVVIPALMTAHGAIKILEVGSIIFRFPCFFFKDQLACPNGERRRSHPAHLKWAGQPKYNLSFSACVYGEVQCNTPPPSRMADSHFADLALGETRDSNNMMPVYQFY
jgi:hypothetical protein